MPKLHCHTETKSESRQAISKARLTQLGWLGFGQCHSLIFTQNRGSQIVVKSKCLWEEVFGLRPRRNREGAPLEVCLCVASDL